MNKKSSITIVKRNILWSCAIVVFTLVFCQSSYSSDNVTQEQSKSSNEDSEIVLSGVIKSFWNKKSKKVDQLIVDELGPNGKPKTYRISQATPEGKACVKQLKNKRAEVTAVVKNKNGHEWLSIKSYKEIKSASETPEEGSNVDE